MGKWCLSTLTLQIYRDTTDIINFWQIDKYRIPQYSDRTSIPRFGCNIHGEMTLLQNIDFV